MAGPIGEDQATDRHARLLLTPRFSPDGQRLALSQISGNDRGIFVYDLQRDTMSRLTFDTQQTSYPTWSPDGKHIVFRFCSAGGFSLGWIRADGAGEIQHLLDRKNPVFPYSFFPDGRRLAYRNLTPTAVVTFGPWRST